MNEPLSVSKDVLFFAFRYALTRSTYASLTIAANIKDNLPLMDDAEIRAYVREIEELETEGFGRFAMEMDRVAWLTLRNVLTVELNQRETLRGR